MSICAGIDLHSTTRVVAVIDQSGNKAGDPALCRLVEIMHNLVRESDLMARIGGEEFVAGISSGHY